MKTRLFFLSILSLLTLLSLFCGSFTCAEEVSLQDIAMELIKGVHDLANDTTYLKQWTLSPSDDEKAYIRSIAEADCSRIDTILAVDNTISTALTKLTVMSDMSDIGKERMIRSLMQPHGHWNSDMHGTSAMLCETLLVWSHCYAEPSDFMDCYWIVSCGDAVFGISFIETGDNIITANAFPMFLEEGETVDTIRDFIRESSPTVLISTVDIAE